MITKVYFTRSLAHLRELAREYNSCQVYTDQVGMTRPHLAAQIRKQHMQLCELLLRRLSKQMMRGERARATGGIVANNLQLAKDLNCTERTIQNLLSRLITAGILLKTFKGHQYAYELYFTKGSIFYASTLSAEQIEKELQAAEIEAADVEISGHFSALSSPSGAKSLPHIINTEKVNNPTLIGAAPIVENSGAGGGNVYDAGQFQQSGVVDLREKGRETHAKLPAPVPEKAPLLRGTPHDPPPVDPQPRPAQLPPDKPISTITAAKVREHVKDLWAYTFTALYIGKYKYLSTSEIVYGQCYFAHQLLQVPVDKVDMECIRLRFRLSLVKQFLDKKPGRYIPIPSIYFNPANAKGFASTGEWADQAKQNAEIRLQRQKDQDNTIIAYREFAKAVGSFDVYSLNDYRRNSKKMETIGGASLLDAYHAAIQSQLTPQ